jgi:membrane protease YdiL (CAAX protease family)
MFINALLSALLNVVVLAGIPFLLYAVWQRGRHKRPFGEIAQRAGLCLGKPRYLAHSAAFALVNTAVLVIWPPPLEPFTREGSPQHAFVGLTLSAAIPLALLYGVIKTGFSEELLFRGLIAGSLSRRLPLIWANLLQALIFLVPHGLVVVVMPELWLILPVIFGASLFMGWVRIKSGSILGPWLCHAAANVTICLSVAMRTTT